MSGSNVAGFKHRVRQAHLREFELHHRVASLVEREIISRPRSHPDTVSIVLDMLIVQGYKAHVSALVIGEHGHIEDMETMVRRLLELAMQATYVGGDREERVRAQRAAQFIAFLWDSIPGEQKSKLAVQLRERWETLAAPAPDRRLGRTRWGLSF